MRLRRRWWWTRFSYGAPIVWRSRPRGEVGFVFGCRVVLDNEDVASVVQQPGDPMVRRLGTRGGPQGRSLLSRGWNGEREHGEWQQDPVVRLHPVGRGYSVIRWWKDDRFVGWYVNLEQPWLRTRLGFDSRDDVLDIIADDDLTTTTLKDEDELEFAVEAGHLTDHDASSIRRAATDARNDIARRRWPFLESAWQELVLPLGGSPVVLEHGWDEP